LEKNDCDCEFMKVKDYYESIINLQKKQNATYAAAATRLNDQVAELAEGFRESAREFNDHCARSEERDDALRIVTDELRGSFSVLREGLASQARELAGLRDHLDNGYQKKLRDAIGETQKSITNESNKVLMDQMMEMLRHVVVGRTDIQVTNAKKFWQFLIQITAAGGLVYMVVQLIVQATRR
jgi:chromosome segregation ATPase